MAIIQRYTTIDQGSVVMIGNTLGLWGTFTTPPDFGVPQAGVTAGLNSTDGIGAFTTLDQSLIVSGGYPAGSTTDWNLNGSAAILNLPSTATVLYAELIWGGTITTFQQDQSANIDATVTFIDSNNVTHIITPDPITAQSGGFAGTSLVQYERTANVTAIISNSRSGSYSIKGVPGALGDGGGALGTFESVNLGWSLVIAYRDQTQSYKNLNIWTSLSPVSAGTTVDIPITGYVTPITGIVDGAILINVNSGDSYIAGDQMFFGPNTGALTLLSTANNPAGNFFQSQINYADPGNNLLGTLNTTGTFGTMNQPLDSLYATMTIPNRQGVDITGVNISGILPNSNTNSVMRFSTTQDIYSPMGIAMELNVNAPDINISKSVDKTTAAIGDILTYTVSVVNIGTTTANDVVLVETLPNGTQWVPGSTSPIATDNPAIGINLGNIVNNGIPVVASYKLLVVTVPNPNPLQNMITANYNFQPAVGGATIAGTNSSNTVDTTVRPFDLTILKSANPNPAIAGSQLVFTVSIVNVGPETSTIVNINDIIPSPLQNVQYSLDGGLNWNTWLSTITIPSLTNGQNQNVLIRGNVPSNFTGTIVNTVTVSSGVNYSLSSTVTVPVNSSADLVVVKSSSAAIAGNSITYTIVATNNGASDAASVVVSDNIPVGISNPQFSVNGGSLAVWTGSTNVGTIVAGNTVTIVITGTVNAGVTGTLVNTTTVASPTPDPNPNNNNSIVTTPVGTSADLSVVKTSSPAVAGNVITYTIVATNNGASDAVSVVVSDNIPTGVSNPQFSVNGGSLAAWSGSTNVGTIVAGSTVTIVITGTVNTGVTGTLVNTVTVASPTPDPNPNNNNSTATTPVGTSADLSIVKTGSAAVAGNAITYTIVATNNGVSDAASVVISDNIPAGISNPQFSVNGGTLAAWTGSTNVGTIVAGNTVTIVITGTVNTGVTGTLVNTVTVASATPDPNPNNNNSTVTTPVGSSADLVVVKTGSPAIAGNAITYTIVATNNGVSDAASVVISDNIPAGISNPQFSVNGGTLAAWTGSTNVGTIVAGNTVTIVITGTVNTGVTGTLVNTVTVASPTPDPNPNNNNSTVTTPVGTSADLVVVKTSSAAVAGNSITYTIVATNNGASDAVSVVVSDNIPSGISNPQFSVNDGNLAAWTGSTNVGTVVAGNTVTIVITGTVNSGVTGTLVNTVTVASPTLDPNPNNNNSTVTTPVGSSADLVVVKTGSPAIAGNSITYTIVATNNGVSDAVSVVVSDNIPAGISNSQFTVNGGSLAAWTGSTNVGTIVAGNTVTIVITGIINSGVTGSLVNTVTVVSPTPDPNPNNNNSTVTTPVGASADLSIIKTGAPVIAGNVITYTIVATNSGPSNAASVIVSDNIPSGISNPQFSVNGGSLAAWIGSTNIGTIVAGNTVTIVITGTVNSAVTGSLVNTVTVASPTPDPNPNNNNSTSTVPVGASADLSIIKTGTPVIAGNVITYTIVATNNGPSNAASVIVSDNIPVGISNPQFSVNGGSLAAWSGSTNVGTIVAGNTVTIVITGTVNSAVTGSLVNTVTLVSSTSDPNPNNNNFTATTAVGTSADLTVVKSANPNSLNRGQQVIYTVTITNLGPSDAFSTALTDSIAAGLLNPEFSIDSGVTYNPWSNLYNLGTISAGAAISLLIRGTISNSVIGTIPNTVTVVSTTSDPNPANNSSTANISVVYADLTAPGNFVKSVDKAYSDVGDQITYTIAVKNTGNTIANNVVITDPIPVGTSYVNGSLVSTTTISGTPVTTMNIVNGIAPNQVVNLSYKVLVNTIPAINPIPNTATISYSYSSNPANPNGETGTGKTNTVITTINRGEILPENAVKSADKGTTTAGDVLTYTVTLKNTGNVAVNNVLVKDVVPSGTNFIQGSVIINSVAAPGENPNTGINLQGIAAGGTAIISFKVNVLNSAINPLVNSANINYSYVVDPTNPPVQKVVSTNVLTTTVVNPSLTLVKSSDRVGAVVGDRIRYTVVATNNEQVDLNNVIVMDSLNSSLQFAGNVTVNTVPNTGNITTGINIGSLAIGGTAVISFDALVISIPVGGIAINTSSGSFGYTVSGNNFSGSSLSNKNTVRIYKPALTMSKIPSFNSVKVGESFSYSVVISNTGDIALNNVIISDILPSAFNVLSISVNGTIVTGNLQSGINIGSLAINETKTMVITVKVISALNGLYKNIAIGKADVITDPNKLPTTVNGQGTDNTGVQVFNPELTITKSVSEPYVIVGNEVTYTIVVKNTGNVVLGNVGIEPIMLYDLLSPALEFVDGTVTINGISNSTASILSGIDIGQLNIGESKTITFKAKIVSNVINPIKNSSNASFGYQLPGRKPETGTAISNTTLLTSEIANIEVQKSSDKNFVVLGDIIIYTVTLKNTGTVDGLNVIFKDNLPKEIELIQGTFSVNGKIINVVDLEAGVNLGDIKVGTEVTVVYSGRIIATNCSLEIINGATVTFEYILPDSKVGTVTSKMDDNSSRVVKTGLSNFKQMKVEKELVIPVQKPDIEEVLTIEGSCSIKSSHVIKTFKGISNEGQSLTGYKLIVSAILNLVVEYTALDIEQTTHSAEYAIPFTTFVVLSGNYNLGTALDITGEVENIYFKNLDERIIFANVETLIKVINCN